MKVISYKVMFLCEDDIELVVPIKSVLETTPETEQNVDTLIEMAETIVKLKFGEDILKTLKMWGQAIEFDDDDEIPEPENWDYDEAKYGSPDEE